MPFSNPERRNIARYRVGRGICKLLSLLAEPRALDYDRAIAADAECKYLYRLIVRVRERGEAEP